MTVRTPSTQLVGKAGWSLGKRSAGHNHVSTERNSLGNSPPSEIWHSALHSEEPGPTSVSELTGQRP